MANLKPNTTQFEERLPPKGCPISLGEFTEQQRVDLDWALEARHISAKIIGDQLTEWGFDISYQTVQRHRNNQCSCPANRTDADA